MDISIKAILKASGRVRDKILKSILDKLLKSILDKLLKSLNIIKGLIIKQVKEIVSTQYY